MLAHWDLSLLHFITSSKHPFFSINPHTVSLFLPRECDYPHFPTPSSLFLPREFDYPHFPTPSSLFLPRKCDYPHFPTLSRALHHRRPQCPRPRKCKEFGIPTTTDKACGVTCSIFVIEMLAQVGGTASTSSGPSKLDPSPCLPPASAPFLTFFEEGKFDHRCGVQHCRGAHPPPNSS